MSKITVALVTNSQPLPVGATTAGTRRFSIINPADSTVVSTQDSAEASVTFSGVPELPLIAQVQTIGDGGALFADAVNQAFSGVPVPPAPTNYDAPASLSVLVERE